MLTQRLLRGFIAASAVLSLTVPSGTRAQDILKELEDTERDQNQTQHSHDHHNMGGDAKKKEAPGAHQGHAGHKRTAKMKGASNAHQNHGGPGRSPTTAQSGAKTHGGTHELNGGHG